MSDTYRGFHIRNNPPPIPIRSHDWEYWHDEYDGAPDAFDDRHGTGPSRDDCIQQIDEWCEENEGVTP